MTEPETKPLTTEQIQLLRDLLDAHIVNLESSIQALDDPNLILVAEEGTAEMERQLWLANTTLDALRADD